MRVLTAAMLATMTLTSAIAAAESPPDPEAVKKAAAAFDDGSRAYKAGQFELAASFFEAADAAVPSARALRMAIRARDEAGQPARASTLAELALARYRDDATTASFAHKTVTAHKATLHRLTIQCTSPCVLALGARSVPGQAAKRRVIWVSPGDTSIGASFADGGGADQQVITARAGGANTLTFLPRVGTEPPPPPKPPTQPSPSPTEPQSPAPSQPAARPPPRGDVGEDSDGPSFIEHPAVFVVSLLATAGVGGVLIWSGIDTLANPGVDTVREVCAGQGPACPEYQQGLDSQLRTNILIGATAGLGLLTGILGIFVTDWGSDDANQTSVMVSPAGGMLTWQRSF